MLTTMETCLFQFQRNVRRWALEPGVQSGAKVIAYGGSGFLLSAAGLSGACQPLAMGLITAVTGWRAMVMTLGAMLGYRVFWGSGGLQGMVWAAIGCLMALLLGKEKVQEEMPLLVPALSAAVTGAVGLTFLFFRQGVPFSLFLLRLCIAPVAAWFFRRAAMSRDAVTMWVCGGIAVLALARVAPVPWLNLGCAAAGALCVWTSFPAAALAGVGLDLARVTQIPMAVVICGAWFGRMIPFRDRWMRYAVPGAACLAVMGLCSVWDLRPLPGLLLGGAIGYYLPPRQDSIHRHGETGIAQVRLEMMSGVLAQTQRLLLEVPVARIDEEALLQRVVDRVCEHCTAREGCLERQRLSVEHLEDPMSFACRKPWEIQGELLRAQERLRDLKADRRRQREYRSALVQQYQFLSVYLRQLSDQLPRRGERRRAYYRLEISARSRGKERANGDRCLAFPGAGTRYYVLLCDGMGTGLGAAQEGQSAGELVRQMLTAGFPPEHTLRSINSILALRGQAGAVTLDLAEVRLDSGRTTLYKWGAPSSYLLRARRLEKIGTATPPPGISVEDARETVIRLSLRRGEMLILVSDGAEPGERLHRMEIEPLPPGELAQWLLKECDGAGEDDATVAVLRLSTRQPST